MPKKVEPGKFYDLEFELQPTFYRLPAGARLGFNYLFNRPRDDQAPIRKKKLILLILDKTQLIFS